MELMRLMDKLREENGSFLTSFEQKKSRCTQSKDIEHRQGARYSTGPLKQNGSGVLESSGSPEVSQFDQTSVHGGESGTDSSFLDEGNPVSPFPEAGNSNSSNSNGSTYSGSGSGSSSSSQGDSNMGGNNDASRSNAEENCNSANAALAGRQCCRLCSLTEAVLCGITVLESEAVLLSEEEMDVLRWGRNSNAVSPPKSVDSRVYKKATALEVLVGSARARR
eukprot:833109-Pelagomonas_calceolata.AAC.1